MFEVEALRFKIIKNHTFYYNFPSKPFKITFKTKKSLSPYVFDHKNGLVCRTMTPFDSVGTQGSKQVPEDLYRCVTYPKNFFHAPQRQALRFVNFIFETKK